MRTSHVHITFLFSYFQKQNNTTKEKKCQIEDKRKKHIKNYTYTFSLGCCCCCRVCATVMCVHGMVNIPFCRSSSHSSCLLFTLTQAKYRKFCVFFIRLLLFFSFFQMSVLNLALFSQLYLSFAHFSLALPHFIISSLILFFLSNFFSFPINSQVFCSEVNV